MRVSRDFKAVGIVAAMAICAALLVAGPWGCSSDGSSSALAQARAIADATRAATTQAIAVAQTQAAQTKAELDALKTELAANQQRATTMPAGQAREELAAIIEWQSQAARKAESALQTAQAVVDKANAGLGELDRRLAQVDRIIASATAGDPMALGTSAAGMAATVPGVGPYAALVGFAVTLGFGLWKQLQNAKAQKDLAAAQVDAAAATQNLKNVVFSLENAGPDWTAADKAAVAALQGQQTTAAVEAIKAALGKG